MADPIDFSTTTLASAATPVLLKSIRSAAEEFVYVKGDLIERRDSPASHISLIRSGLVRLGIDGIDGSRFNMSILGEGNTFGEISLFLGESVRHDAHAETDVVLDRLPLMTVNALLKSHSEFSHVMLRVAYARFGAILDYVADTKKQSLETRAAKLILGISKNSSHEKIIECRQVDLAHALNVSRVSIGKALKALDRKGLITLGYGNIAIPSIAKLDHFIIG